MPDPGCWGPRLPLGHDAQARVTVVAIAQDLGGPVEVVRYRVRLDCCGREVEQTHRHIVQRRTAVRGDARYQCTVCIRATVAARKAAERAQGREARRAARAQARESGEGRERPRQYPGADYGVTPPEWPRPPSIAPGAWRWG